MKDINGIMNAIERHQAINPEWKYRKKNQNDTVIDLVVAERKRQDRKWGQQNHGPDGWLTILVEEVGEVARAILEGDANSYKKEMVQVAAVAVAALESFERGNAELGSLVKLQEELKHLKEKSNDH